MSVAERGGDDGAVVLLLAETKGELLAFGLLGHGDEHLVVLVGRARAIDDERYADGGQDAVHRAHGVVAAEIAEVGVAAAQLQRDQIGSRFRGPFGPRGGVAVHVAPDVAKFR